MIYSLGDRRLETAGDEFWVAPNATVIGSVRLGANASVWFNAVIRGEKSMTDTIDQDVELLADVQRGMTSTGFDRVFLNEDEMYLCFTRMRSIFFKVVHNDNVQDF